MNRFGRAAVLAWTAALLIWGTCIAAAFFYRHTPVWPDEAVFASTALSLAEGRGFATPVLRGQVPGAEHALLWMPPLHTALTAATFAVTGPSVEAMRALSVIAALIVMAVAARLVWWHGGVVAALVAATCLLVDARFLRVAFMGRMDVLAIALVMLAIWQGARAARGARSAALVLAGLFAGLAISTHPIGLAAVAALTFDLVLRPKAAWRILRFVGAGFLLGLAPLAAMISVSPRLFVSQMQSQFARKQHLADFGLAQVTWNLDPRPVVALALWAGIAAGFLMLAARWREPAPRLLLLVGVAALVANVIGPEVTYVAWLVVPAAVGLGLGAAGVVLAAGTPQRLALVALCALVGMNAAFMALRWGLAPPRDHRAYAEAARRCVFDPAPDGTRLLIHSLPEAYFAAVHLRDRLDLRLPAPTADAAALDRWLRGIDVVLLGPLQHHPPITLAMTAQATEWHTVPLRPAGGYQAAVAFRKGREFPLPPGCSDSP